jgi:serine/threonine protein kinase
MNHPVMTHELNQSEYISFADVTRQLGLLDESTLSELHVQATARGVEPVEIARSTGLLSAIQLDIVETMRRPTEIVPGYRIMELAGQGGMGVVYRAQQIKLDRTVAIKTLLVSEIGDAALVSRFQQEAQTVARLQHPNIVVAHDFGQHEGRLYLVMEYIDGYQAEQLIQQTGSLSEALTWGLIRQTAAGLAHAATHGVVHRDVKPANLLLLESPEGSFLPADMPMVRITDFGLAYLRSGVERGLSSGTIVGSPHYMAPEQFQQGRVDERADIYSLGATAFHMFAGSAPFAGRTLTQIVSAKVQGEVPELPHTDSVSAASRDLVRQLMAASVDTRLSDYQQVIEQIDALGLHDSKVIFPAIDRSLDAQHAPTKILDSSSTTFAAVNWRRRLLISLFLIAVVCLAVWPWIGRESRTPRRVLVPTGPANHLFDGQNLEPWLQGQTGIWTTTKNGESASVLQGINGMVRRRLNSEDGSDSKYYILTLLVDVHQADSVEVRFGIQASATVQPSYFLVRLLADQAVLGQQRGSVFRSLSDPIAWESGSPRAHVVQIERQPTDWWVTVDGKQLGIVEAASTDELSEFRLVVNEGPAWFSDIFVQLLHAAEQTLTVQRNADLVTRRQTENDYRLLTPSPHFPDGL